MIPTIARGKTKRIPKTAIKIPQVRNRALQTGVIYRSTVALTTALSKETETSRIVRTKHRNIMVRAPAQVPLK
jgi:hypothetical protein